MRILMVDYFLPNSIYSLELCKKLSVNNEVILVCKDNYNALQQNSINFKILPILHSKSNNPMQAFLRYIHDLKKIDSIIDKFEPEVLHLQEVQHPFWETLLLRKNRKRVKRYFFTAHNILSHEAKIGEKERLNKWYKNFDGIIVHNENSRKMFLNASDYSGSVFVVPHGSYDTYKDTKSKAALQRDKISFLQFGIIRDYKGVDILLKAISMLPNELRRKTNFIIAGALRKKYYDYDVQAAVDEYKIQDCTELIIRRIDDDEVPELFNRVDCCVFPYRHIYGSGALLMAYTFNKPVIVSSIPVFEEETDNGKTGLIFEKNNPESLCEAIIAYCSMSDNDRLNFGDAISNLVEKKYNWTHSAALTLKCYQGEEM